VIRCIKRKETHAKRHHQRSPAIHHPTAPAEKSALETAMAQIEIVRTDFRNAIAGLNKLGDQLKSAAREQKASEKEVQSVRQTLRSLQSVRI